MPLKEPLVTATSRRACADRCSRTQPRTTPTTDPACKDLPGKSPTSSLPSRSNTWFARLARPVAHPRPGTLGQDAATGCSVGEEDLESLLMALGEGQLRGGRSIPQPDASVLVC